MKRKIYDNYKSSTNKKTIIGIRRIFALFNVANTIAALLLFLAISYVIYLKTGATFNPYYFILFIPLMSIVTGMLSSTIFINVFRYLGLFEQNIEEIANGNYEVEMPIDNANFFTVMSENFNKMAKELKNNKILKVDFVRNFSHELKTPLSSINGFANLLLTDDISKEDRKKYLEIIRDESYRLTHLAEKSLFLSKLNSDEIIADKKEFALDEQIRNVIILMQSYWEEKDITINANLRKIKYYNNPEIIKEIWINLLSNAVKYTPKSGIINIQLTKKGNNVIFSISDNGIGIETEKLNNIFDEYYQTDVSHSTNGVGLGLSIVKKIVDLVKGTIDVKSEINKGTEFVITLPNVLNDKD